MVGRFWGRKCIPHPQKVPNISAKIQFFSKTAKKMVKKVPQGRALQDLYSFFSTNWLKVCKYLTWLGGAQRCNAEHATFA